MTAASKFFTILFATVTAAVTPITVGAANGTADIAIGAPIRDNYWTSGADLGGAVTQVLTSSASQNSISVEAEGTGFEPATGFPASDFESDR
jgi:hypothetical protein